MGPQEVVAVQSYLSECTKICLYLFMKKKKNLSCLLFIGLGWAGLAHKLADPQEVWGPRETGSSYTLVLSLQRLFRFCLAAVP